MCEKYNYTWNNKCMVSTMYWDWIQCMATIKLTSNADTKFAEHASVIAFISRHCAAAYQCMHHYTSRLPYLTTCGLLVRTGSLSGHPSKQQPRSLA
ncbi:hypothetical protein J6590_099557 [Homalodisca vitripennis]|nr:hypothetical protein J6590_099557 [Homalodisca vitripennis]